MPSFVVLVGASAPRASAGAGEAAESTPRIIPASSPPATPSRINRTYGTLALAAVALVALNLVTTPQPFWARWPLLVIAVAGGLHWARRTTIMDRRYAGLAVIGLGMVGINLLSWSGQFWAIWPLLGLGVLASIRWLRRNTA